MVYNYAFCAVLLVLVIWNFYISWINSGYIVRARSLGISSSGMYFGLVNYKDPRCPPDLRAKVTRLLRTSVAFNLVCVLLLLAIAHAQPL